MKELIEKSVKINGIGRPDLKTIFSIEKEEEKKDPLYFSLEKISGRKLTFEFKYVHNDQEHSIKSLVSIPFGLGELEVKDFILVEIANLLK